MYGRRGFFAGKAAGDVSDKAIINPVMLRFRPIAPKPVTGGSSSGESQLEKKSDFVTKARPKRKYVRGKKSRFTAKNVDYGNGGFEFDRTVFSQQLSTAVGSCSGIDDTAIGKSPVWLSFVSKPEKSVIAFSDSDRSHLSAVVPPGRVAVSSVTVECVTEAFCMDEGALGCSDVERIRNLEADTCPSFVSDGGYRVMWINGAYRRMVRGEEEEEEGGGETPPPPPTETAVELVVKVVAELPVAFACRVKVEYTWREVKWSRTMPCDVWRMEWGGFAWRLDVKAALSLGR